MKRMVWVALLTAALGCDKRSDSPVFPAIPGQTGAPAAGGGGTATAGGGTATGGAAPAPAPSYGDTAALWAMAPPDAVMGFVLADGAGSKFLKGWGGMMQKLRAKPYAKTIVAQLDQAKQQMGFDVWDEASYKQKGIDMSKGGAIFVGANTDKPALAVFPVGDRDAFRTTMKATAQKVGDRDVDKTDDGVLCTVVGTRYICAMTVEAIDASTKPHDSPLATAVKALPAEDRGDFEFYVEVAKIPQAASGLKEVAPLGNFDTVGGAIRFDPKAMNLVAWAKGSLGPIGTMMASASPPADLAGLTGGATSVIRMRLDPKLFAATGAPTAVPGPNGQQVNFADLLSGDVEIVTAGKGLLSGAIFLKVTDVAKVKPLISQMCAEMKKDTPPWLVIATDANDHCGGKVVLSKDKVGFDLPPQSWSFGLDADRFTVLLGDIDLAALKGSAADEAGSPETQAFLAGPTTVVAWTRHMGVDTTLLPPDLQQMLTAKPEVADGLNVMNWSASQFYDIGAAFSVTAHGVRLAIHSTTYEADPADALAALDAAFDKRAAGDRAGFVAALGDIETKFPGTLAARRAKLERVGTPMVGPIMGTAAGIAAAASAFAQAMMAPSTIPAPTPEQTKPSQGGGFGQPGNIPSGGNH